MDGENGNVKKMGAEAGGDSVAEREWKQANFRTLVLRSRRDRKKRKVKKKKKA